MLLLRSLFNDHVFDDGGALLKGPRGCAFLWPRVNANRDDAMLADEEHHDQPMVDVRNGLFSQGDEQGRAVPSFW
jgi:hypothetical protein